MSNFVVFGLCVVAVIFGDQAIRLALTH